MDHRIWRAASGGTRNAVVDWAMEKRKIWDIGEARKFLEGSSYGCKGQNAPSGQINSIPVEDGWTQAFGSHEKAVWWEGSRKEKGLRTRNTETFLNHVRQRKIAVEIPKGGRSTYNWIMRVEQKYT